MKESRIINIAEEELRLIHHYLVALDRRMEQVIKILGSKENPNKELLNSLRGISTDASLSIRTRITNLIYDDLSLADISDEISSMFKSTRGNT